MLKTGKKEEKNKFFCDRCGIETFGENSFSYYRSLVEGEKIVYLCEDCFTIRQSKQKTYDEGFSYCGIIRELL